VTEPTFDADGYPTEESLACLAAWPYQDAEGALDFMAAAWSYPEYVRHGLSPEEAVVTHADPGDAFIRFATGGWSGNESLIDEFRSNQICWAFTWRLSSRGGCHIFQYPDLA
jgi:hypothetical protein